MVLRVSPVLRQKLAELPGIVDGLLGRRGTLWWEVKISMQESQVSPSECRTTNPSASA